MARLDRYKALSLYEERTSRCTHVNGADVWGIRFDTPRGGLFIYSAPGGGLFFQDWQGEVHQMEACQFIGKTSKAVKKWLDEVV